MRRTPDYEIKTVFKKLQEQLFPENQEALVNTSVLDYIDFKDWINGRLKS